MLKVVRSHNKSIYSPCKVESTYIFFQKKKLGTLKNFLEILPTEKVDWTGIWNWKYLQKKWWIYEKTVRVLSFMTLMSLVNLVIVFNQYEFCMDLRVPDFWDTTVSLSVGPVVYGCGTPPAAVHTLRWRPSQRMAHGLTLGARSNARYWFVVNCRELPVLRIFYLSYWVSSVPSKELTYPTWGKGKSSSKVPWETDMLVPGPAS